MGLVEYADSATESEAEEDSILVDAPPRKKPRQVSDASKRAVLPSLPTAFHDLYASNTRVSVRDDPNLHGGRKRVIPHVEGNWPTHIYLECNQILPSAFEDQR
jgi:U6 snRNA phosphodiesterase